MKRTLALKAEHLTELSTADLAQVAGGALYPTLDRPCPTVDYACPTLDSCMTGVYPTLDRCV